MHVARTRRPEAGSERCKLGVTVTVILRIQVVACRSTVGGYAHLYTPTTQISAPVPPSSRSAHSTRPLPRHPQTFLCKRASLAASPIATRLPPPTPFLCRVSLLSPQTSRSSSASASASRSCILCASNDRSCLPMATVGSLAMDVAAGVVDGALSSSSDEP